MNPCIYCFYFQYVNLSSCYRVNVFCIIFLNDVRRHEGSSLYSQEKERRIGLNLLDLLVDDQLNTAVMAASTRQNKVKTVATAIVNIVL